MTLAGIAMERDYDPLSSYQIRRSNELETWAEIRNRHQQEKINLVKSLSDHYTYAQAARILEWDARSLVRFCHYWEINFYRSNKGGYNERSYK